MEYVLGFNYFTLKMAVRCLSGMTAHATEAARVRCYNRRRNGES